MIRSKKTTTAKGPSEVTAIQVIAQETPVTYEYTAQTESSQLVEIRTRVSGFLDKRMYKEGSQVRSGQTLFQIDRKPFEAQLAAAKGELSAQQARHSVAQATLAQILVCDGAPVTSLPAKALINDFTQGDVSGLFTVALPFFLHVWLVPRHYCGLRAQG